MCTCCSVGTSITACTLRWNCFLRFSPAERFSWQISTGCKPKWTVNAMQCAPAAAVWITATQWQTDVSYQKWLLVSWAGQFFHGKKMLKKIRAYACIHIVRFKKNVLSRTGVKHRWEYVSKAESLALLCPSTSPHGRQRQGADQQVPPKYITLMTTQVESLGLMLDLCREPLDLQSDALPLSYTPCQFESWFG